MDKIDEGVKTVRSLELVKHKRTIKNGVEEDMNRWDECNHGRYGQEYVLPSEFLKTRDPKNYRRFNWLQFIKEFKIWFLLLKVQLTMMELNV